MSFIDASGKTVFVLCTLSTCRAQRSWGSSRMVSYQFDRRWQSQAVAVDAATVRTSYISGILTQLAQSGARRLAGRRSDGARPALWAALCIAYLAGATLAGRGMESAGPWCLAGPVGLLAGAAAVDRWVTR